MAANPSFLSEGYYVNITEQYKGMCFNLNSIAVPEFPSLFPSFTESSQYSQFKNGRMSGRKHNCSARSFSAVYVNLRHNRLCLPEYLPKRVFEQLCVCIRPLRRYLKRASLSLCTRALSVCGSGWGRVPKHVQMIHFTLWWLNVSVNPRITCVPNRGDWSVRIICDLLHP